MPVELLQLVHPVAVLFLVLLVLLQHVFLHAGQLLGLGTVLDELVQSLTDDFGHASTAFGVGVEGNLQTHLFLRIVCDTTAYADSVGTAFLLAYALSINHVHYLGEDAHNHLAACIVLALACVEQEDRALGKFHRTVEVVGVFSLADVGVDVGIKLLGTFHCGQTTQILFEEWEGSSLVDVAYKHEGEVVTVGEALLVHLHGACIVNLVDHLLGEGDGTRMVVVEGHVQCILKGIHGIQLLVLQGGLGTVLV